MPKSFLQNIDTTDPDGCWLWIGSTRRNGDKPRAYYYADGVTQNASRYAWKIFRGDPGKKFVLHTCDNQLCVNPEHLYLGTQTDNIRDRVRRNPESWAKGEQNAGSKLTESDVIEIRHKYIPRKYTIRMLSDEYGVCRTTIHNIIHRKKWAHS